MSKFFSLIFLFPMIALANEAQPNPALPAIPVAPATPVVVPAAPILELQTLDRDKAFEALVAGLDLDSPEYVFEYKSSGTSLGFKVKKAAGGKVGKWMPTNESANPEGQVVSYRLGRVLNMSELVIPSAYFTVKGKALDIFAGMISARMERNVIRRTNQINIENALARNSSSMFGAFVAPVDQFEVANLVDPPNNTINFSHPIAAFIRADGPMPGSREMSLDRRKNKKGVIATNSELNLAREFSKIMVLDILNGQYDRWSGGNVEEVFDGAKVNFIARDNGGSYIAGPAPLAKYFGIVSRFDRAQIRLVAKLAEALRSNPAEVAKILYMRSNPKSLINRVNALLNQVNRLVRSYGEGSVYFPE